MSGYAQLVDKATELEFNNSGGFEKYRQQETVEEFNHMADETNLESYFQDNLKNLIKVTESTTGPRSKKELNRLISIITQAAETKDGKKILADIGLITKEGEMPDTEKDLNELNIKLAEENKQLRETAELLFKENQTLRNELNTLNVIILRKAAQEVGIQYGQPQPQETTTASS